MTVQELIEKLQECNPSAKVSIETWSSEKKFELEINGNNGIVTITGN